MSYAASPPQARSVSTRSAAVLVVFLVASLVPDILGVLTTLPPFSRWWTHAEHLGWSPPIWVFEIGWTLVYIALGVAGWLVWRRMATRSRRGAMWCYLGQSVLQVVWTVAFLAEGSMQGDSLWAVFGIILILDAMVLATAIAFWPISRVASGLMWLAFGWLVFGSALSLGDTVLISLSR